MDYYNRDLSLSNNIHNMVGMKASGLKNITVEIVVIYYLTDKLLNYF